MGHDRDTAHDPVDILRIYQIIMGLDERVQDILGIKNPVRKSGRKATISEEEVFCRLVEVGGASMSMLRNHFGKKTDTIYRYLHSLKNQGRAEFNAVDKKWRIVGKLTY